MPAAASNEQLTCVCAQGKQRYCARSLSRERKRSTRACSTCAPRRAGWSRSIPYKTPLRQRDVPLLRRTAVFWHASRGLQREVGVCVCAHAIAPPHALPQEEEQHARLRSARAAPRWFESVHSLWKHKAPAKRPSRSVHGRVLTCQPRPPPSSLLTHVRNIKNATVRALSLSGGSAARSLAACARRAALVGVSPCPTKAHCPSETPISLSERPCSDVAATASIKQLSCACTQEKAPPRALSLSGGGASHALASCARRAALVGVGPCPLKAHCANETPLSLGARPCSDMPAAASSEQLTCACAQVKKRHCARSLSLSGRSAARALAARARPAALVGVGPYPMKTYCASEKALSLSERSVNGRALTCQPRPPTRSRSSRVRTCVRATARSPSGGCAARTLSKCARRAALVGVGT